jgi:hypothetical protein
LRSTPQRRQGYEIDVEVFDVDAVRAAMPSPTSAAKPAVPLLLDRHRRRARF